MQEKTLIAYAKYNCSGGFEYANDKMVACHKHTSPLSLKKAIAISCNSYFCNVFQKLFDKYQNTEIAFDKWQNHIASFGVGQWMNNDFASGKKGLLPTTKTYDNIYGKTHWNASTVLSLSIGQGELLLTPIQMANISAIIANRGYYLTPHIVKKIGNDTIAFIYEPLACHSYNVIKINGRKTKIATIDTILSFYLAFLYTKLPYYTVNRILCMSEFLFQVQQKNRLKQKGLLRRFSINCYGKQLTLDSMRAEKSKMFKKLKGKRGTKLYDEWFLRYVPNEEKKQTRKRRHKKSKKNNRTLKRRLLKMIGL